MSDEYIDRFLIEELRLVNKHAPYERKNLCDLLKMEVPYIVLRDGSSHLFNPRELAMLAEILGDDACRLELPIIVEYTPSNGEGVYVVRGGVEARAVAAAIGLNTYSEPLFLSRVQILELRRVLRTTTTILLNPGPLS